MRRSMTAYGRAVLETKQARWTLEISSVNRKGLDVHLHLPHSLLFLDPKIRKWVAAASERGNVTIRISCTLKEATHLIDQLESEKKRWKQVAAGLGFPENEVTLPFLLSQVTLQESAPADEKEIIQVWKKACKAWTLMKEQEGKLLVVDITSRLKTIEKEMKEIEKELPHLIKDRFAKLSERMEQLKVGFDPEQLQKEAALQVDRDDVTEEMIRLKSHMQQMTVYFKSKEMSVGRTLDFLAQEMGREIGTLMAKAGSSTIAQHAVHIKSEVEKIREQVQNIE